MITIVQNVNDIMLMEESQGNILTTVDTITLQSNMMYNAQCLLVIWMENLILLVVLTSVSGSYHLSL